jgi:hypothetical protein
MITFAKREITIGNKTMSYRAFTRRYICNTCGGGLVEHHAQDDATGEWRNWVQCGNCGEQANFVTERAYDKQISDGFEVIRGLPAELRTLLEPKEESTCLSATEAIADLYDLA